MGEARMKHRSIEMRASDALTGANARRDGAVELYGPFELVRTFVVEGPNDFRHIADALLNAVTQGDTRIDCEHWDAVCSGRAVLCG